MRLPPWRSMSVLTRRYDVVSCRVRLVLLGKIWTLILHNIMQVCIASSLVHSRCLKGSCRVKIKKMKAFCKRIDFRLWEALCVSYSSTCALRLPKNHLLLFIIIDREAGSVLLFVCPSVRPFVGALLFKPFDLDFRHECLPWPWSWLGWDCKSR